METLAPIEARIIGSLIEKAFTTPDQYPLSLNALLSACNQRSNRDPVMSITGKDALDALQRLRDGGWVTIVMPSSGRIERYRQTVRDKLDLDGRQQAVIAELLLRGPQTAGEIRTRCARMKPFESLEVAQNVLTSLAQRPEGALVERLPPSPGGRAERWAQRLSPRDNASAQDLMETSARTSPEAAPARAGADRRSGKAPLDVGALERRIAALEARVDALERGGN